MKKLTILVGIVGTGLLLLSSNYLLYIERNKRNIAEMKLSDTLATVKHMEIQISEYKLANEALKAKNNYTEPVIKELREWVYNNSSRISKATAYDIVINTLQNTRDPIFFLALFEVESGFDPTCISTHGAMGLGQIMKLHVPELKKAGIIKEGRDLFNIKEGIQAAEFVWAIKWKEGKEKIRTALTKYLGGQSKKYSDQILENYFHLSQIVKRRK